MDNLNLKSKTFRLSMMDIKQFITQRDFLYWFGVLSIFARFIDVPDYASKRIAILFNLFIFSLVYLVLKLLIPRSILNSLIAKIVRIVTVVILTFPYGVFQFDRAGAIKNNLQYFQLPQSKRVELAEELQTAITSIGYPNKIYIVILSLLIVSIGVIPIFKLKPSFAAPISVGVLLMYFSSWFNQSLGSSYGSVTHFAEPQNNNFFWLVARFRDGTGLVSGDEFVHSSMVEFFQSGAGENLMLIRRPIGYYLVSQFTYLFNSYYVWIILNYFAWVVLLISSLYIYSKFSNKIFGYYFIAATIGVSPLCNAYVAQTSPYLFSFTSLIFLFAIFFFLGTQKLEYSKIYLGLILGVQLLTYDTFPWLIPIFFLLFKVMKLTLKDSFKVLATGLSVYLTYLILIRVMIKQAIDNQNSEQIFINLRGIFSRVKSLDWYSLYEGLYYALKNSPWLLTNLLTLPIFMFFLIMVLQSTKNLKGPINPYTKYVLIPFLLSSLLFLLFWSVGDAQYLGLLTRMYSPLLHIVVISLGIFVGKSSNSVKRAFACIVIVTVVSYSLSIDLRILPNWQQLLFDLNFGKTVVYIEN
jgi:hypothetical protein